MKTRQDLKTKSESDMIFLTCLLCEIVYFLCIIISYTKKEKKHDSYVILKLIYEYLALQVINFVCNM